MNDQEIQDLLRQADRRPTFAPICNDLADRVRRRSRQRKNARHAVAGLIWITALTTLFLHPVKKPTDGHPSVLTAQTPNAPSPQESAQLAQQTADDITRLRRYDRAVQQTKMIDPLDQLHLEVDQTASVILEIAHGAPSPADRRAAYQRIRQLFPQTPAGHAANQRLQQMSS